MNPDQIEELAALHAVGALDGDERSAFEQLLRDGNAQAHRAVREFQEAAALGLVDPKPAATPSSGLRQRILDQVQAGRLNSAATAFNRPTALPDSLVQAISQFVPHDPSSGWTALSVPGAFVKLLSFNKEAGYAVVLGRLEPGRFYPAHQHIGPEELYMLSGDLHIGDLVLRAGDFHHSDAGSVHGENHSTEGCTLLAVISSRDVLQQLGVA